MERVDPRIERSRMLILEAAVDELAESGYGGVTIEAVAVRAGVAKSTIYRHWPDKLELIADAFETFHQQMVPDHEDRSARESVELLLRHVAEVVVDSRFSRCIPALIEGAERDGRVRRFHQRYSAQRRRVLIDLIARGIREQEISPDVDPELATSALLGAIFYRRLMSSEPFDPDRAGELVSSVLGRRPGVVRELPVGPGPDDHARDPGAGPGDHARGPGAGSDDHARDPGAGSDDHARDPGAG